MTASIAPASFETFGDLLKYLRRRTRLTQSELAAAVNYSREQITKLENNQRAPDLTILKARFLSALELEHQPELFERLLALASTAHTKANAGDSRPAPSSLTNLSAQLTSFVGRARELADIKALIGQHRLLALTGAGGTGKTRLALQMGAELLEAGAFADGVWLAELVAVREAVLVPGAVAAAFNLSTAGRDPASALADSLREKHCLLILDNCEHILLACAQLAETLLRAAPKLYLIATSRESLGVLSAVTYRVPSLTPESEAVQLFAERAQSVKPTFALTPQNATTLTHICRRLDGLPLAIELAATRVRALSVEQIAHRLDDRFQLLTGGHPSVPRHQTLRAALDWSYDLLSAPEQALLRALAVFVGGWNLEAAEALHRGEAAALDLLTSLIDKSLVVVEEHETETRYRLLETIREYAGEKLRQANEAEATHRHHAALFLRWAEQSEPQLRGGEQKRWYARFEMEHDNLRAAFDWAVMNGAGELAVGLLAALWFFWFWRGYWAEGTMRAKAALAVRPTPPTLARAKALIGASNLAGRSGDYAQYAQWLTEGTDIAQALHDAEYLSWARQGLSMQLSDYEGARRTLEEGLAFAEQAGNAWLMGDVYFMLGDRARGAGQLEQATIDYQHSVAHLRQAGDHDLIGNPLGNLGRLALRRGDLAQAQAAFEESLALYRAMDNQVGVANWLLQLANVAVRRNDPEQAREALAECFQLFRELGNQEALADCLVVAAALTQTQGHLPRAATLLGAASRILEKTNWVHRVVDQEAYTDYAAQVTAVRAHMAVADFELAWAEGQRLELAQVMGVILKTSEAPKNGETSEV